MLPPPGPRSVFDRLGRCGSGGPPPGWDAGPPPGRFETPEERAAREAEIDRRLRAAEGIPSPVRERAGSGSGR
jgi:hypothetical protein